jgi:hypothetical protein
MMSPTVAVIGGSGSGEGVSPSVGVGSVPPGEGERAPVEGEGEGERVVPLAEGEAPPEQAARLIAITREREREKAAVTFFVHGKCTSFLLFRNGNAESIPQSAARRKVSC